MRNDSAGKTLVAYWLPRGGDIPSVEELKRYLLRKLPAYMVPSVFMVVDQLPLTPSGKVDRKALPAPRLSRSFEKAFVPPRTPLEETLASIWKEVLAVEQVGIHDNFFELGGHSLAVTRVVSRVRQVLELELPLLDLFESPTIAGLARRLTEAQAVEAPGGRVPPLNVDSSVTAPADGSGLS